MFKRTVLFLLFVLSAGFIFGQSLTRIAVIDMQRVYNEFFLESQAARDFGQRFAAVQAEVNRMTAEINELRSRYNIAVSNLNYAEAERLTVEINRYQEYVRNYTQTHNAQFDIERRNLSYDRFLNQMHDEIRYIAESEGYTYVFDKNTDGLLWFSTSASVDLTDRLLQSLRTRFR